MAGKKQVMDMRSTTSGVSSQESDEQQRNWTKQHWEKKAKDSLSNYDPTRAKLNLEVVRGGIIQPIDTSKTIDIKQKGISTMITNLQTQKDEKQTQIDQIAKQFGQSGTDYDELANKMALLRKEMEGIDEKLTVRYKMLDDANDTINEAKAKLTEMREEHREMLKSIGEDNDLKATAIQKNILGTYNKILTNSIEPLIPSLSDRQQEILDESGYNDLTTNTDNIINCAMLLVLGYIREATTYAQSCGGGSSPGTGWGRDKDEDDEHWWRRCIAQSAAMMRPATHKRKRGR